MEYINNYGIVSYHLTPWNSRQLNAPSLEIDGISPAKGNEGFHLINDFAEKKRQEGYVLVAARISANDLKTKKALLDNGFYIIEHTLDVVNYHIDTKLIESLLNRFPVTTINYNSKDFEEISNIAYTEFKFGRFFEDPYISEIQAKNRNKYWIQDLISSECIIKVLKKKDKAVGFMAYKEGTQVTELILGGVKEQYRHLSYGFWANVLMQLSDNKPIRTLISSSNIDILSLYSFFGFRFENPQFGFHKHFEIIHN